MDYQVQPRARRKDAHVQAALDAVGLDRVCELISAGRSLVQTAQELGVGLSRLQEWFGADPARAARVREAQAQSAAYWDHKAEQVLQEATDKDSLAKARELSQLYRWRAKIYKPAQYGDKVQVDSTVEVKSDPGQVEAQLRALLSQGGYALPTQGQVIEHASAEDDDA